MLARSNHYFTTSLYLYSLSGATDLKIKIKSGSGAAMFVLLLWISLATVADATWENAGSKLIQWDFRTRPLQIKTPSRHQFDLIVCELKIELQSSKAPSLVTPHWDMLDVVVTESSIEVRYCDGKKSIKTDFDDHEDSPFHFKSGDECYWIVSRVGGLHTNISLNDHLVFTKPNKPDEGDDHECLLQDPTAQLISFAIKSEEASYNTAEMCGVLKIPNSVNGTYKEAPPGTILHISCREGFTLHGPTNVTCQDSLSWTEPIPRCDVIMCPGFSVPNSDSYHGDQESVGVGKNVSVECDIGYELVGESNLTCLDDGTWDSEPPKCEPGMIMNAEMCGVLKIPNSVNGTYDETPPGTILHISCKEGFTLHGPENVTCQDNLSWTEPIPKCDVTKCPGFSVPNSGSYHGDQESVGVGKNVSVECDIGYELVGESNLTCLDDGTWDSEIPKCEPEDYDDEEESDNEEDPDNDQEDSNNDIRNTTSCPDIPHAKLTQTNQANKYEVSCNHGYVSITTNNTIVTCDDGEWLEDVPECEKPELTQIRGDETVRIML
eukprot:sb/3463621/